MSDFAMNWLTNLQHLPDGLTEISEIIHRLDQCLLSGFARFDKAHDDTLASMQRVFTGTPLQASLETSGDALRRNEFAERHFAVIAAARAALQGTGFDLLHAALREAFGRPRLETPESPETESDAAIPPQIAVWLESARQWLMEVALAGFAKLELGTVTPFMATLEHIQEEPQLVRQSAMLTGFVDELLAHIPVTDLQSVPLYRWSDLWTHAMIGALKPRPAIPTRTISGVLRLIGCDVRHHAHLVSVAAYGLLESDSATQLVRVTLSAYKVDAISNDEIWLLFPNAASLFEAFSGRQSLHITEMPLLPTGDLIWNGNAAIGEKYDILDMAAQWFAPDAPQTFLACQIAPADRHPAQLAEPLFLKEYQVKETEQGDLSFEFGENLSLRVAMERLSPIAGFTRDDVAKSQQMCGLLRFDAGQWAIQPFGIVTSKKGKGKKVVVETVFTGDNAAAILKKPPKVSTVAQLQERASRLLRKKS